MWHGHGNVLHQTQVIILFQIPEWVSSERRPSQIRPQHLLRSMINTPAIKPCFWPGSLSSSFTTSLLWGFLSRLLWKEHCSAQSTQWLRNNCNPEQHHHWRRHCVPQTACKSIHIRRNRPRQGLDTFKWIRSSWDPEVCKHSSSPYQWPVSLHIKPSDICISRYLCSLFLPT